MHVSSFGIFICAVVFVAWVAIWLRNRLWERHRRTRQAEWEALWRGITPNSTISSTNSGTAGNKTRHQPFMGPNGCRLAPPGQAEP
jgi:hypothetical protein